MKSLLSLLAIGLLASNAFGDGMSLSKVDAAQQALGVKNIGPVPPESLVAHGLVDENGNLVLSGSVGTNKQSVALTAGTTVAFAPLRGPLIYTLTPAQAETINATTANAVPGQVYTLQILTSGTTSYTVTFGTGFTDVGTLETGTTTAIVYDVRFLYDGTTFREVSRTRQSTFAITVPYTVTTSTLPYAEGVALYNFTPTTTENLAISAVGRTGASFVLHIIGDASAARTITFTTNAKPSGTLATGSSGATDSYATFLSDGTNWRVVATQTGGTP